EITDFDFSNRKITYKDDINGQYILVHFCFLDWLVWHKKLLPLDCLTFHDECLIDCMFLHFCQWQKIFPDCLLPEYTFFGNHTVSQGCDKQWHSLGQPQSLLCNIFQLTQN